MSSAEPPAITTCPILHRDRFIVIVNKPAGILSHPNTNRSTEQAAFEGRYDLETQCFDGPGGKVWLIHRLDQDTSGILLGALDEKTAEKCLLMFEEDAVQKQYLALVRGHPGKEGTWLDHLATSREKGRVRTSVIKGRQPNAELDFQTLAHHSGERLSLLNIHLITGKTHQIRVQASSRQHHLLGDDVYGHFELNRKLRKDLSLKRLFLHAHTLTLKHPASGQRLQVKAPLPPDLASVLDKLGITL
ncbi:23S rRNA pseudouridine1911/1915/1917 synthase [Prosthecobacter fusiformis]|uniref:23S rRNA pseudouridine1911/1915/1917 synthase n=1 Tax=Prosthecobacter fusiformis TaxID=48464 RepID=A0A4R7SQC1_9BACT|nr:RluA family pseudouridine synthase [Prosthecobacter fusiformis]TDU80835.1 23S rRNA pseudouridine1911/1915/1917 synthase [Prosthecobacter fusiformis]